MSAEIGERPQCATSADARVTRELFRLVGDKWSLVVVSQLGAGPVRFTTLLGRIEGISHRLLGATLKSLERDGLVIRVAYAEIPPRVEYELSALGRSLAEPVVALADWAERHREQIEASRARYNARLVQHGAPEETVEAGKGGVRPGSRAPGDRYFHCRRRGQAVSGLGEPAGRRDVRGQEGADADAGREGRLHRVHARALEGHAPLPSMGADCVEQRLAPAARRREQDQGEWRGSRVEGRRARPAELERLAPAHGGLGHDVRVPEDQVKFASFRALAEQRRGADDDLKLYSRVQPGEVGEGGRQVRYRQVLKQADAALPGERLVVLFESGPGLVVQLQYPFGVCEQLLAVWSRKRPAGVPDDELLSDDLFKPLDALADHWLGQAERGRAASDAARPDRCREAAQVGDLQVILH